MQWEVVSDFLGNVSGMALGLVLFGLGVWLGIRQWQIVEARKANVPEG